MKSIFSALLLTCCAEAWASADPSQADSPVPATDHPSASQDYLDEYRATSHPAKAPAAHEHQPSDDAMQGMDHSMHRMPGAAP